MKYFKLKEFTASPTASRLGMANDPDPASTYNLIQLVSKVLDPAREYLCRPITITSGYRSQKLNEAVNGVPTSQHRTGHAADITCEPSKLPSLYDYIANNLEFDQLIYYRKRNFIHVSYVTHRKNRQQIIIKK